MKILHLCGSALLICASSSLWPGCVNSDSATSGSGGRASGSGGSSGTVQPASGGSGGTATGGSNGGGGSQVGQGGSMASGGSGQGEGNGGDATGGTSPAGGRGGTSIGGGGGSSNARGGGTAQGGAGATGGNTPTGGASSGGGGTATGALHVNGNVMNDGDGQKVALRGPELVIRWGVYSGITSTGVDVAWEGGTNNNVGSPTIREIAKTKANAIRIYGGIGNGLEDILHTAIVEQKMFVGVGRVDWANPQMMATLKKYQKYVFIHPRGEFTYTENDKPGQWRTDALTVVKYIRGLGYTSPIEIGTTGYGQTWSTIQKYGKEVADSDPLKNTLFLLQLYSELANAIPATLNSIGAFGSPVNVDSCLFPSTYGNTANTYKQVWDQSYSKGFGSFYWDWWGDGDGNSMTSGGTLSSLNAIGQYIANDSPGALKNTVKTPFLLNAAVP